MGIKIKKIGKPSKNEVLKLMNNMNSKTPVKYTAFALLGICLGVVCETLNHDVYTTINVVFDEYLININVCSALNLMVNSLLFNFWFLITAMILGLCAIGYIFLGVIPFIKGLGIGCVCGYFYSAYAIKGVLYCAVLVFPVALIQLISIIISCNEANLMSKDILAFTNKKENVKIETDLYILRFSVTLIFIAISCLLYAVMSKLFSAFIVTA